MPKPTVADLGEFGLVDRIASIVGQGRATVGIGDDAAVLPYSDNDFLLVTVDLLVQGVHFPERANPLTVGRRAVAVNLSDIAAMGGSPSFAVVSLALAADTPVRYIDDLYAGLVQEAARFDVEIVGGNTSRTSGPLAIDVALLGVVPKDEVVLRSGARVGDVLAVTGVLGAEAARRLSRDRDTQPERELDVAVPEPRIETGRALAAGHLVHAMVDLSDGLGSDLHHVAAASGVGAVIYAESLPVAIEARESSARLGLDPQQLALYGGEDYELLVAIAPDQMEQAVQSAASVPLYSIGTVLAADQGVVLERIGGAREPLTQRGWTHF